MRLETYSWCLEDIFCLVFAHKTLKFVLYEGHQILMFIDIKIWFQILMFQVTYVLNFVVRNSWQFSYFESCTLLVTFCLFGSRWVTFTSYIWNMPLDISQSQSQSVIRINAHTRERKRFKKRVFAFLKIFYMIEYQIYLIKTKKNFKIMHDQKWCY